MDKSKSISVITIDGPSGTGKGTVAQKLAQKLGWHFLDSGALYRVLALAAEKHEVALDDDKTLEILAGNLDVQFSPNDNECFPPVVIFEGEEVTLAIRTESCGSRASIVAAIPGVRKALLDRQRAFRESPGLIAEGRDMGTVVFPDAPLKIYLDASPEERAKRRVLQLKGLGENASLAHILTELKERDERDKNRQVAPLVPAKDAVIIDTSSLDIESVLQRIQKEVHHRFNYLFDKTI